MLHAPHLNILHFALLENIYSSKLRKSSVGQMFLGPWLCTERSRMFRWEIVRDLLFDILMGGIIYKY